jgi:hypothetical protein
MYSVLSIYYSTWSSNNYFPSINLIFAIACRIHFLSLGKFNDSFHNRKKSLKMRPSSSSHYTLCMYPHSLFFVATSGFSPRYYYTKTANWCCTFGICRPTAIWTRPDVVLFQVIFTYIRTRWPCETEMSSLVCSGKKLNWYLMANWSVELKPSEVISAYTISVIMFIQLFLY